MLISSVTLGLLSDKYGRKRMISVGFVISILATISALFARNYLLLNIAYMLMSFSQVGVANALCVLGKCPGRSIFADRPIRSDPIRSNYLMDRLSANRKILHLLSAKMKKSSSVMEATPPKLRFVAVFEYGIGWGLGQAMVPFVNDSTKNYQHFLIFLLAFQLALLPWLNFGIFESIRWLISEAKISEAQIELRRACNWNRKTNGAKLAQKIAQVQVQQLRKASCVIETKLAPMRLVEQLEASQELDALGQTIRRSIALNSPPIIREPAAPLQQQTTEFINGGGDGAHEESHKQHRRLTALSPTLARHSFSLTGSSFGPATPTTIDQLSRRSSTNSGGGQQQQQQLSEERQSLTTKALVQLALKHSKTIQQMDEGSSFLARMFHRKLYKMTLLLMLASVMLETTYYSLVQANGFVGGSVNLNYYSGAVIEWIGAFVFILVFWAFNRRLALVLPTISASLVCSGIALTYHLIPDSSRKQQQLMQLVLPQDDSWAAAAANSTSRPSSLIVNDSLQFWISPEGLADGSTDDRRDLLDLREQINFWLMIAGKLSITVAIQIAALIAMEAYPNNLRQSGSGAIVFVGRVGSILAPFLINDTTPERTTFKLTLVALASLGGLISILVPCFLPDNKDQELCDRLNEIPEENNNNTGDNK